MFFYLSSQRCHVAEMNDVEDDDDTSNEHRQQDETAQGRLLCPCGGLTGLAILWPTGKSTTVWHNSSSLLAVQPEIRISQNILAFNLCEKVEHLAVLRSEILKKSSLFIYHKMTTNFVVILGRG